MKAEKNEKNRQNVGSVTTEPASATTSVIVMRIGGADACATCTITHNTIRYRIPIVLSMSSNYFACLFNATMLINNVTDNPAFRKQLIMKYELIIITCFYFYDNCSFSIAFSMEVAQ